MGDPFAIDEGAEEPAAAAASSASAAALDAEAVDGPQALPTMPERPKGSAELSFEGFIAGLDEAAEAFSEVVDGFDEVGADTAAAEARSVLMRLEGSLVATADGERMKCVCVMARRLLVTSEA